MQNADMGLKKRVKTKADNPKIVAKNMFIGLSFTPVRDKKVP